MAQYFTGQMALTRVKQDDNLNAWFTKLMNDVKALEYGQSQLAGNVAGRKIQNIISALEDVERFEEIDTSLQIKQFLSETRDLLTQMVRIVNVTSTVAGTLDTVSDFSYAWELMNDYVPQFHGRVRRDPRAVILLRAVFLKLVSILDVPLTRIVEASSPDYESVADYYSGELVEFVRRVLDVIPRSIFSNLSEIIQILTNRIQMLPLKLETVRLKAASQLDHRFQLAQRTHQISVFSEGILAMEETKLGMIEVDSRQILDDGVRKELVRQISTVMHLGIPSVTDKGNKNNNVEAWLQKLKQALEGFKKAVLYIQDYVSIYGLKMWQEEFSRIVNFNIEQECNRYITKKIVVEKSIYWKRAIPIPIFSGDTPSTKNGDSSRNFMGRLLRHLERITNFQATIYAIECSGWYNSSGEEIAGSKLFSLLNHSVGAQGLAGIDRLLAFKLVHGLKNLFKSIKAITNRYQDFLRQFRDTLKPQHKIPGKNAPQLYVSATSKLSKVVPQLLELIQSLGQGQLLRRSIANELRFSAQLDSKSLSHALDNFNKALMNDLGIHYKNPDVHPAPKDSNPLLFEFSKYLSSSGKHDPLKTIFVTTEPLYIVPMVLFIVSVTALPQMKYDKNLIALARRDKRKGIDGGALIVGIATILKQFHSQYMMEYMAYMGQFVRATMHHTLTPSKSGRTATLPYEVANAIVFLEQLVQYAGFERSVLNSVIPNATVDLLRYARGEA